MNMYTDEMGFKYQELLRDLQVSRIFIVFINKKQECKVFEQYLKQESPKLSSPAKLSKFFYFFKRIFYYFCCMSSYIENTS